MFQVPHYLGNFDAIYIYTSGYPWPSATVKSIHWEPKPACSLTLMVGTPLLEQSRGSSESVGSMGAILYIKSLVACIRPSVTTGRREKWREKDKTTVGWRAFEVLKPRSWEWNPVPVYWGPEPRSWEWNPVSIYRGPETQVLIAKCSNASLQARADCVRPSRVPTSVA
jgi:hypothetical protein